MARQPLNRRITNGNPYTVPTGKNAVFRVFAGSSGAGPRIDGVPYSISGPAGGSGISGISPPITAGPGAVISHEDGSSTGDFTINGWLYDA